jgi:NAD(P)-dependent dehydrogenase (short-subunit alcohol dehydrogenase family)
MAEPGIVAVTGASRGIGAAIVLELARRGFTVGCLSRGGRGHVVTGDRDDVTRPASAAGRRLVIIEA